MPEPRQPRPPATGREGGGPSAMARASGALPHRPYVPHERAARQEPPEVTAARERHRAVNAQLAALKAERDGTLAVGPGTGWDPLAATELAGDAPPAPRIVSGPHRWPGEPEACTCTRMVVDTLGETLGCPCAWTYVPGTGWLHILPARQA